MTEVMFGALLVFLKTSATTLHPSLRSVGLTLRMCFLRAL